MKSISDLPNEQPFFDDLEIPGQLPVQEVLMILSYKFLKFLHYLCFWGQGIHSWHFYWATLFGDLENLGQLPVQDWLSQRYVLMIVPYGF